MRIINKQYRNRIKNLNRGDTIVEVLIAIAVAAFAIGTSYAIANKSLQRAVQARERNEAVNIIQNQISDLKVRYQAYKIGDPAFINGFALSAGSGPNSRHDFCLDDNAKTSSDAGWARYDNNATNDSDLDNMVVGSPGYNAKCKITIGTIDYYVDIATIVTSESINAKNPTIYKVTVRWPQIGTGGIDKAGVYYRLGPNSGGLTLSDSTGGSVTPPSSTTLSVGMAVMQDTDYTPTAKYPGQYTTPADPPHLFGWANGVQFLDCTFTATGMVGKCPGTATPNYFTCGSPIPGTNGYSTGAPTGKWDVHEVCYTLSLTWNINLDPALLQTLDFQFTNDRFYFNNPPGSTPIDSFDNNILVFGLSIPSHAVRFGYYCQVTNTPVLPAYGSPINSSNLLPLYWDFYTAHLFVDSNTPSGGNCT